MAAGDDLAVRLLIEAQDNASRVLQQVTGNVGGLNSALAQLATSSNAFGLVTAGIVALGAASVVLGKRLSDDVEQLERMRVNTGATIEELQVARQVIDDAGGEFGNLAAALSFLNIQIGLSNPMLRKLGLEGKAAFPVFMELSKAFAQSSDTATKATISRELLGRGSRELQADMAALTASFAGQDAAMRASGQLITEDLVPAAMELDAQVDQLRQDWKAAWVNMEKDALPAATNILTMLSKIIEKLKEWRQERDAFSKRGFFKAGDITLPGTETTATRAGGGLDLAAALGKGRGSTFLGGISQTNPLSLQDLSTFFDLTQGESLKRNQRGRGALPSFKVSDLVKVPDAKEDPLQAVKQNWIELVEQMTSDAEKLNGVLGGLWSGMQAGFMNAFTNLVTGAQSFGQSILGIFRSMVSGVLAELGRIAAAQVFGLILKVLGVAVGAAVGGPAGAVMGAAGFKYPVGVPSPLMAPGGMTEGRSGTTINNYFNAIDMQSIYSAVRSPAGHSRRADEVMAFSGAM